MLERGPCSNRIPPRMGAVAGAASAERERSTSDGLFCTIVQRPLARPIATWLAPWLVPNAATALDFAVGIAAAGALALGYFLEAVALIQLFGVLSCVDGEIARIRASVTKIGDYLDTLVDRVVELAFVEAAVLRLSREVDAHQALWVGLALVGGIFLLTASTEKFSSAFGRSYPKRLEPGFALVSSGSDTRLLVASAATALMAAGGNHIALLMLAGLAAAAYLNLVFRLGLVTRLDRRAQLARNP